MDKAHRLFQSAMFSPGLYTEGFNGTEASFGIEDHYPSSEFGDDLFWASTWLYRASTNNIRTFNISYYREAMATTMALACASCPAPSPDPARPIRHARSLSHMASFIKHNPADDHGCLCARARCACCA